MPIGMHGKISYPTAPAMPSASSRRRRRRPRRRCKKPCSFPEDARDWAALPDILIDVFHRLGPCREIMRGAERVCTAWRRAAVDEPTLWKRIDIATISERSRSGPAMVRAAVDRSDGWCEAFYGPVDEDSLLYLAERTPLLKSLHLSYGKLGNEVLNKALKKLTLLEDLDITTSYSTKDLIKYISEACPHLEKLRVTLPDTYTDYLEFYNERLCEISTMCKLRALELFEFELTIAGLTAILDNCPLLESLQITGYFFDIEEMDEELQVKCARVKNLILPDDEDENDCYEYYEEPWD